MPSDDPLFTIIPDKAYFAIGFDDVPPEFILGGRCLVCDHVGPFDRHRAEKRYQGARFTWLTKRYYLRCMVCGNRIGNTVTIVGRYLP